MRARWPSRAWGYGDDMRILVTSTPGTGHLLPIAPLARELQAAGHEIVWATAVQAHERVARLGFRAEPAGLAVGPRTAAFLARSPEMLALPPRDRRRVALPVMFGEIAAPAMLADLRPVFDAFEPQLVLHDLAELAAAPLAASRGIPCVTIGFSGAISDDLSDAVLGSVSPLWAGEGVTASPAGLNGDLLLHPFPATLDRPRTDGPAAPMRPVAASVPGSAAPPDWLDTFGTARPGLYVTFGTEAPPHTPWRAVLDGLADLEVDAVLTVGPGVDPDALGPVPSNTRVEHFVPQELLLGRVRVVVSHAGAGTVLGTLAVGLTHLAVPMGADQWDNADLVAAAGAGETLEPDARDAAAISAAIDRLLGDADTRAAAAAAAQALAAMPHPRDLVPDLERLVARGS